MRAPQPAYSRDEPRKRTRWVAALALAATIGFIPAVLAPAAALADAGPTELNAITSVTINPDAPDSPLTVWQQFKLVATWAAPAGANAGDTFSLSFPGPVIGYSAEFDLLDANNVAVGSCAVTDSNFLCTLNDYVTDHTSVAGTLFFFAQSSEAVDSGTFLFTTGSGVQVTVPIPGGPITVGEPSPAPTEPMKWGWLSQDGRSLTWQVWIPAEVLAPVDGADAVLTDVYDSRLSLIDDSLQVSWIDKSQWDSGQGTAVELDSGAGPEATPGTYTFVSTPATHSFTVVLNQPNTDGSRLYLLQYETLLPANAAHGDVFGNTISARGQDFQTWPVTYVTAGGDGSGQPIVTSGSMSVTKAVTGNGASVVPASTAFAVTYSYLASGVPVTGSLSVKNGETASLTGLPTGTVVTINELAATPIDGVTFAAPKFSGTDVTVSGNSATVTIGVGTTVAVQLENVVTAVVVPTVPVIPTVPTVPTVPVVPTVPSVPSVPVVPSAPTAPATTTPATTLASTGADVLPLGIGILVLLALGGGLLSAGRRRSRANSPRE
jgi:hypothetical protein